MVSNRRLTDIRAMLYIEKIVDINGNVATVGRALRSSTIIDKKQHQKWSRAKGEFWCIRFGFMILEEKKKGANKHPTLCKNGQNKGFTESCIQEERLITS
jgi:hypothetical protein